MTNPLSVVIITKNEENYIEDAIKSAEFADEIIVLDSGSTDETCNIAKNFGVKLEKKEWLGFGAQKNYAVNLASFNWVFVLDADERISEKLKNEINTVLEIPRYNGYHIPRLNWFFGKSIKTCGLYPDFSIRLFNKNKGRFSDVSVHESVILEGKAGKLKNHMNHLAYENVEEFIEKQKYYAKLSKKKKNFLKAMLGPCWTFFKIYILKRGFIEGWRGLVIAKIYSKYTFWKYIKKS
jgi:glycosyltransferase involved in cell wall biosynthesis